MSNAPETIQDRLRARKAISDNRWGLSGLIAVNPNGDEAADLIDAQQEAIAALVKVLEVVAEGHHKDYTDNYALARAAIAKAKGDLA